MFLIIINNIFELIENFDRSIADRLGLQAFIDINAILVIKVCVLVMLV